MNVVVFTNVKDEILIGVVQTGCSPSFLKSIKTHRWIYLPGRRALHSFPIPVKDDTVVEN